MATDREELARVLTPSTGVDVGPWGLASMVLASDWLAATIAAAEQRGREDNARHEMCYVHGSNALAQHDAEVREATKAGIAWEIDGAVGGPDGYIAARIAREWEPGGGESDG